MNDGDLEGRRQSIHVLPPGPQRVEFQPDGGSARSHLEVEGGLAKPAVGDSGTGIDPRYLAEIFEMFRQVESARAGKAGLGFGLALVKRVELPSRIVSAGSGAGARGSPGCRRTAVVSCAARRCRPTLALMGGR